MELGEQAYHNSILLSQESWKGFLEELINKLDLKNKKKSQLRQLGEKSILGWNKSYIQRHHGKKECGAKKVLSKG